MSGGGAFIAAHATGASLALVLGGYQLWRTPRGDVTHRMLGRVWVVAMYWTVLSSFFIKRLNPGHYSWIHLLSIWTFISLTTGIWAALRGRIDTHRGWMIGSYCGLVGAFIGAVAVPDRDVPQLVVHRPVVFTLAVIGIVIAAATVITCCVRTAPRATNGLAGATFGAVRDCPRPCWQHTPVMHFRGQSRTGQDEYPG